MSPRSMDRPTIQSQPPDVEHVVDWERILIFSIRASHTSGLVGTSLRFPNPVTLPFLRRGIRPPLEAIPLIFPCSVTHHLVPRVRRRFRIRRSTWNRSNSLLFSVSSLHRIRRQCLLRSCILHRNRPVFPSLQRGAQPFIPTEVPKSTRMEVLPSIPKSIPLHPTCHPMYHPIWDPTISPVWDPKDFQPRTRSKKTCRWAPARWSSF